MNFWNIQKDKLLHNRFRDLNCNDYIMEILKIIKETQKIERATYLKCTHKKDGCYNINGLTYPNDKILKPLNNSKNEILLLSKSIILKDSNERNIIEIKNTNDGKKMVEAHQICVDEGNIQHILILTKKYKKSIIKPINQKSFIKYNTDVINFFKIFIQILDNKYLLINKKYSDLRHTVVDKIITVKGSFQTSSKELCKIWCNFLNAKIARIWIFNSIFNELNLLAIYSEDNLFDYDNYNNQLQIETICSPPTFLSQPRPNILPEFANW